MDVTRINEGEAATRLLDQGQERAQALAEARQRATAEVRQSAAEASARQAQLFAESREVIARAIGANTRLSITKSDDAGVFVFRAIDTETGEVVLEWPPEQFYALVDSIEPGAGERLQGLLVDSEV